MVYTGEKVKGERERVSDQSTTNKTFEGLGFFFVGYEGLGFRYIYICLFSFLGLGRGICIRVYLTFYF